METEVRSLQLEQKELQKLQDNR